MSNSDMNIIITKSDLVKEMLLKGYTYSQIVNELKCSMSLVSKCKKELIESGLIKKSLDLRKKKNELLNDKFREIEENLSIPPVDSDTLLFVVGILRRESRKNKSNMLKISKFLDLCRKKGVI